MRIHSDVLTSGMIREAGTIARVGFTKLTVQGSRSRKASFDVILNGESRRRQNQGEDFAATWDQWGVFLSDLFNRDPNMKCWAYDDAAALDFRTNGRFMLKPDGSYWPEDAHGDHRFRYEGTPCEQKCTKCSAVTRWEV